jgi:hypothetical protein
VRAVASLREYAGQVGSRFAAPLIAHRQLTQDEVIEIGRLYGRIELLRTFIGGQLNSYSRAPEFATALERVEKEFFDGGFQFLDFLLQIGLKSGDFGVTPSISSSSMCPRWLPSRTCVTCSMTCWSRLSATPRVPATC